MERKKDWFKEMVLYQIYPRSFADSNGDGVGDLNGIIEKLDYLEDLGVNAIWLSPIYKSPNVDNGYDIADYKSIMDEFGSFDDWKRLRDGCHRRGMHLIMDLVLNHTSDQHEWFKKSRQSKNNSLSNYYIWHDPVDGGRPNNWESVFGGSAWEFAEERGQYYLHLFAKEQPDLNWECKQLREEIFDTIRWWIEQGTDGFRVDAISYLEKPNGFPNSKKAPTGADGLVMDMEMCSNLPKTHQYIHDMKTEAFEKYNVMTVGEVACDSPACAWDYVARERREFDMIIPFVPPIVEIKTWSPKAMKDSISSMYKKLQNDGWWARFLSNHDKPRQVSLYGDDGQYWEASAKMLATMLHMLPGTPFIYQGEEIGMTNAYYSSIDEYDDIDTHNFYQKLLSAGEPLEQALSLAQKISRDNARSPMQWDGTENTGFTSGTPWIKVNPNHTKINVQEQLERPNSIFKYYQKLIKMRKEHPIMVYGDFMPLFEDKDTIIAYTRSYQDETWLVLLNFCKQQASVNLTKPGICGKILLSNYGRTDDCFGEILLDPYEALVLQVD